ncbi:MAG TPA: hypothetical protein VM260_06720, partial [Pirellula sp.]|nr:hypothetical protein [Pirellula sp.]
MQELQNHFERDVYPLLSHPEKGCIDCHNVDGTSSLVLTGNANDDFRLLLDEQYLKPKGVDTLLTRVTTKHSVKRMPKDAEPWSEPDVQKLKSFLDSVQKTAEQNGSSADEQFPRSLLSQYFGTAPSLAENQFLTYWQLKGKIKVIFNDDWVRGDRDLFAENLSMLGGADFKTRFNESSQPTATFLTGLEMLARDVANHAYEQRTGPFRDWPTFVSGPLVAQSIDSNYRNAIQQLYEHVLFRPATTKEIEEAYALLCEVFEEEESIKAKDDELGLELVVKDVGTGQERREMVRIPVSGDLLQVKQFLIDQTEGLHDLNPAVSKSRRRKVLASNVRLEPETPNQRLVMHNVASIRNVSFAGIEILDANGMVVESIGLDSPKIDVAGAWKITDEDGFKSYEDGNQSKGMSSITISLRVASAGVYQLVLLWRDNERNAKRVLAELYCKEAGNQLAVPELPKVPPLGEAHFSYDCSTDSEPFAEPKAVFQFSGDGEVEIKNKGTLEAVTAGAIEFVSTKSPDHPLLIDSKDAVGNEDWKRFADGRFKAYNAKGAKLHDDNERKGELSLAYRLNSVTKKDWNPADYCRIRIYYPGKKDQECQVPVI